ncbi:phosphatase PAP2 family protein [Winogradskyella flava]|uniref:Phosphatase PAP2 family protein n=1 Tax=Winogradskyella flava TaxID=1884876 RepID=A0A842IWJ1_9FLAO|nr:phosphatase PAP2 family protein [Winogradskyella flava]MBC2846073.1 phosphatase PAP2 family protein [Winogradskyella flava]
MLEKLLDLDTELFLYLNKLGSSTWDWLWLFITDEFSFVPLYAILLFLIYRKYGVKPLLIMVLVIAAMITFTDQITNLFKDGFMRPRPCRLDSLLDEGMRYIAERCGKYGFFSGHSSNSMAAAVFGGLVLRPYFKNLIFLLLFWSFIVAYSRIYVGVHYPLDIVCGMAFGALAGFGFYKLNKYMLKRFITS